MRLSSKLCALLILVSMPLLAESKNPADYPLRIHVFPHDKTNFYYRRYTDESKGEGRANLFENGNVHGVDFSFDCSANMKGNLAYETYPAKWKRPNQELIVLLPVFGKANSFFTCNVKSALKDEVYVVHEGRMEPISSAEYKTWMVQHNYDPEHDKNTPTNLQQTRAQAAQ